jgi:3-phenylpropionate/cinnamic acid dioxygenase small subunit
MSTSAMTALDYEEVRQLLARYNFAVDLGDFEGWADCFTEDGYFHCTPEGSPLTGMHKGRAALIAYAKTHYGFAKGTARHWNWNLEIQGDGQTATMRCYMAGLTAATAQVRAGVSGTGIYWDKLVKQGGKWLFASRHIHLDPQPEGTR